MGKMKATSDTRPLGYVHSWARTPGGLIAGQAAIDQVDMVALAMEAKWGAGRLRLLVGPELCERFDRQRYLLNQAIWHGELIAVQREASRMVKAWQALDKAATSSDAAPLSPQVWEVALEDGTVVALVRDASEVRAVSKEGRKVAIYTLDEIARVLANYHAINEVKMKFPGAQVTAVRRTIDDPLDAVRDSDLDFDDPLPDPGTMS